MEVGLPLARGHRDTAARLVKAGTDPKRNGPLALEGFNMGLACSSRASGFGTQKRPVDAAVSMPGNGGFPLS
jgi:hypothetical protein